MLRLSMVFKLAHTKTFTTLKTSSWGKMVWELQTIGAMGIKQENWFMRI
jgi:hypothetical protein